MRNDSWFGYVCGLDDGDDWQDEAVWPKANPLLDVTVTRRYLREQVQEARDMPAHAALVARLNFCVWTEASAGAMVMERWDACAAAPLIPRGSVVYAGLDLSSTSDMASLVLLYEDEAGVLHVEPRFWCPAAAVEARTRRDHLPYALWAEQGYLTATDGDVIDYDAILADLTDLAARYQLAEVGFLRLNATQFVTAAGALSTMVPISQTYTGMSRRDQGLAGAHRGLDGRCTASPPWRPSDPALDGGQPRGRYQPDRRPEALARAEHGPDHRPERRRARPRPPRRAARARAAGARHPGLLAVADCRECD